MRGEARPGLAMRLAGRTGRRVGERASMIAWATSTSRRFRSRAWVRSAEKGSFHADATPLGDHSLGLLDRHPALERLAQLFDRAVLVEGGSVLEDGSGGDIGQRLRGDDIGLVQHILIGPEEVEGADGRPSQPHGNGAHRATSISPAADTPTTSTRTDR